MNDLAAFLLARIAEDELAGLRARNNAGSFGVPDHVVRWTPERVLAECEAKRRIVDEHQATRRDPLYEYIGPPPCITCGQVRPRQFPCVTLRALALPYVDHPDYRPEWRP